ncbi:MAG: ribonuclease R family protein [Verrucomicrobiales bacterium]
MAGQSGMQKKILSALGAEGGRPLNKSELARNLSLPGAERAKMREALKLLLAAGEVVKGKRGRYQLPVEKSPARGKNVLVGRVRFMPSGHAWFMPDLTNEENLASGIDFEETDRFFVQQRDLWTALNGDEVLVRLQKPTPVGGRQSRGKPVEMERKGKVEKVLKRRSGQATGILVPRGKSFVVNTDDERLPDVIEIEDIAEAKKGQVVAVELTKWEHPNDVPVGRVVRVLGWPDEAGVDVQEIIHQHGLAREFPPEVLEAARSVPEEVEPVELERREDWRDRDVITIDPADAKDHDDAIWVEKTAKGWRLAVHIADVSHYVKPGSIIDQEAVERGNSTYLVDRVMPMLPVELSNGICSLKPGVDRLSKCALMDIEPNGRIAKAEFFDAVIRVPRKLTYEEAQEILEGKGQGGRIDELVKTSWELASLLRKRRFENGALDLDMPEVRIILNEKGVPTGYKNDPYNESHQLVEEFMLAANEAVARALKNAHRPNIYRVHEDPDADRLQEFAELARSHGYEPGDLSKKQHIQALIDAARGTIEEHNIKLGLLKSLKRAAYMTEPLGHYGLSKNDYCHFTSPIRRYADLITHRSLQALLTNKPRQTDRLPKKEELAQIAEAISNTERTSADAENESRRMKMLEWLDILSRAEEPRLFEAIITELRPIGLFIECTDILQRGLVKREDITPRGRWRVNESVGRYEDGQGSELRAGQQIKVRVKSVDLLNKNADFVLVEAGEMPNKPSGATTKPSRAARGGKVQKSSRRQNSSSSRNKSSSGGRSRRSGSGGGNRGKNKSRRSGSSSNRKRS